ncbi:MAG: O-antigen ligase family protein, partial [Janthinobacterium lividum]
LLVYSVATSSALRHHLLVVARSSRATWFMFLTFLAMQFITLPMSNDITFSLNKVINDQIYWTGMTFLGCLLFTRRGQATKTVAWMVGLGMFIALDGFLEFKLQMPPWSNYIPSFLHIDDSLLANVLGSQARSADGLYRVRGPYTTSLLYAEYLALIVPFILHWMLTGRSLWLRVAMFVAWAMVTAAILLTNGRLGLVGWFLAHLGYLLIWGVRRWRTDPSGLMGPSVVLGFPAVAAVLMAVILSSNTLSNRILGGGPQAASDAARRTQREMTYPKVLKNPIGYGASRSGATLMYVAPSGGVTVDNLYISMVLDYGVVGLFSFFAMFVFAAWSGIRLYFNTSDREIELEGPLGVTMIVFVVIRFVLSQDVNITFLFLLLGMVLALKAREDGLVPSTGDLPAPASLPGYRISLSGSGSAGSGLEHPA